jgi:hypothetical protein
MSLPAFLREKGNLSMIGFKKASFLVLCVGFWLATAVFAATEKEVAEPSANPLIQPPVKKESTGAAMRHPFHHVRKTWEDYFKVYDGPLEGFMFVTPKDLTNDVKFYLDRKVQFDAFYCRRGDFFRPFLTPFHQDNYVNFVTWPYGAKLWETEQRTGVMPFLYISRSSKKLVEDLDKLPTYQPIHVWGTVRAIAEGYPWIEVTHFKQIPEKAYTVDVLRDFELGCRSLDAKDPVTAIKAFDSAVAKNPPPAGLREA